MLQLTTTVPRLLLLDEPLSAVDVPLREQLGREIRHSLIQLRIPAILATHDKGEALSFADYVVIFDEGRIRQSDPIEEVFHKPADLKGRAHRGGGYGARSRGSRTGWRRCESGLPSSSRPRQPISWAKVTCASMPAV